jgi:hypothetical protein
MTLKYPHCMHLRKTTPLILKTRFGRQSSEYLYTDAPYDHCGTRIPSVNLRWVDLCDQRCSIARTSVVWLQTAPPSPTAGDPTSCAFKICSSSFSTVIKVSHKLVMLEILLYRPLLSDSPPGGLSVWWVQTSDMPTPSETRPRESCKTDFKKPESTMHLKQSIVGAVKWLCDTMSLERVHFHIRSKDSSQMHTNHAWEQEEMRPWIRSHGLHSSETICMKCWHEVPRTGDFSVLCSQVILFIPCLWSEFIRARRSEICHRKCHFSRKMSLG